MISASSEIYVDDASMKHQGTNFGGVHNLSSNVSNLTSNTSNRNNKSILASQAECQMFLKTRKDLSIYPIFGTSTHRPAAELSGARLGEAAGEATSPSAAAFVVSWWRFSSRNASIVSFMASFSSVLCQSKKSHQKRFNQLRKGTAARKEQ